jgi:hypothetical protein
MSTTYNRTKVNSFFIRISAYINPAKFKIQVSIKVNRAAAKNEPMPFHPTLTMDKRGSTKEHTKAAGKNSSIFLIMLLIRGEFIFKTLKIK